VIAAASLAAIAPSLAAADQPAVAARAERDELSQLLAGRAGIEMGGRTSPGGFHLAGTYLYRMAESDWIDTGVAFTFGGGNAECFRDRSNEVLCDHGITKGFAAERSGGVRRVFRRDQEFAPFVGLGLAVRLVSFSEDDVRGVAFPLLISAGVRSHIADRVALVGGAMVRAGIGLFTGDVGLEPQASLAVSGGVEFGLD
jgi:hypothetical protein